MGACDDQIMAFPEEELFEGFGEGNVGEAPVEHGLEFRITSGDCVSNNNQVRVCGEVVRRVASRERDALIFEEGTHGGVDILIGSGDLVALGSHGGSDGPHGGAADADKVDVL